MLLPSQASDLTSKLVQLWQRKLPQTLQRLHQLDHAASAAASSTLTPALRDEAASLAHTFAGTLGTFGHHEATRLSRELERHWRSAAPDPAAISALTTQLRHALPLPPPA